MSVIITGMDEQLGKWMVNQIEHFESIDDLGAFKAIGVATGFEPEDKLQAVVAFHDWFPQYGHCQISVASADPRWVHSVRSILAIPFYQYRCNKVWVAQPHTDTRAIALAKRLGFTQEGGLKDHLGRGKNAIISRMLIGDYERKYWNGKVQPKQAAVAA